MFNGSNSIIIIIIIIIILEYLMGVGVNVSTWFISLDKTPGDGFLEWIMLLLALGDEGELGGIHCFTFTYFIF